MENTNANQKTDYGPVKIDGVSAQINLSPGSEAHQQFAKLMKETGASTARNLVVLLMNHYENPQTDTDSATAIAELERKVANLRSENQAYDATVQNLELDKQQLTEQLETARNEANENAQRGTLQQNQLEELQQRVDGAIILRLDPTTDFFVRKMADEVKVTPARMIAKLLCHDIQNPNANHWPAETPSGREFRRKFEELKQKQQ